MIKDIFDFFFDFSAEALFLIRL